MTLIKTTRKVLEVLFCAGIREMIVSIYFPFFYSFP